MRMGCAVHGRVQMVLFRDFAQRNARRLSICGIVRNLSDGSVRVEAEGEHAQLEKFLALLEKGPILARVDSVDVEWCEDRGEYDGFIIVY